MNAKSRRLVQERARFCFEYCQLPEIHDLYSFHLEHIIAKQHGGGDGLDNLAWSCHNCNAHKGPNLSGRLRDTGEVVLLFNPRRQKWSRHFRWVGPLVIGRTKSGKATIDTLELNAQHRVALRRLLIVAEEFPPPLRRDPG